MKRVVIPLLALGVLAACNTVEGVAEDVKQTSQTIRRAF